MLRLARLVPMLALRRPALQLAPFSTSAATSAKARAATVTDRVMSFWFPGLELGKPVPSGLSAFHYAGGAEVDAQVQARFRADIDFVEAEHEEYMALQETSTGSLTLILLLDQFTRNCFRNSRTPFEVHDPLCRRLAHAAIARDHHRDKTLHPLKRTFFFLPFEHHEHLDSQRRAVQLFKELLAEVRDDGHADDVVEPIEGNLEFARRHLVPIERFGRFPHRNKVLGRSTTVEEQQFLDAHAGFL